VGTDNLFHKRRARRADSLHRRRAKKSPYEVVLIVCEGGKTEPNYFNGLKKAFRINSANIRICGCGEDPLRVVKFAIKTFREEKEFDRVYCVFDRDRHASYHTALEKINHTRLGQGAKIFAVPSVPCFEFWLLLHFTYTTKPFQAPVGESICSRVIKKLKTYLPNYEKGSQHIFQEIQDRVDDALVNAHRIEKYHQTSGTDNPSTSMHLLVEYLHNLQK